PRVPAIDFSSALGRVELFTPSPSACDERDLPCVPDLTVSAPRLQIVLTSIAFRFASRAGYPLSPSVMRNGETLTQAGSGRIDWALSNASTFPGRAQRDPGSMG